MTVSIAQAFALHQQGRLAEAEAAYAALLERDPDHFDARHLLGLMRCQEGRFAEAIELIEGALTRAPDEPQALYHLAFALRQLKRDEDAVTAYRRATEVKADFVEAHYNFANALRDLNRLEEAAASYRRALALRPELAEAHNNLGVTLRQLGRPADAALSFREAVRIRPEFAEAQYHLANTLFDLGRHEEAVAAFRRFLELRPDVAEAHYNLGVALRALERPAEAVRSYRRALELQADFAEAHNNLGVALRDLKRLDEAAASYRRAIELAPGLAGAHNNLGVVLRDLERSEEALTHYRRAIEIWPEFAEAHHNLAVALQDLGRVDEALAAYQRALAIRPDYAEAHHHLGNLLWDLKRPEDAIRSYRRALEIQPERPYLLGDLASAERHLCDWRRLDERARQLLEQVRAGRPVIQPFAFLAFDGEPADQLRCAEAYVRERLGPAPAPLARTTGQSHERLRLAYLSADFHEHATAWLTAELFERHDRTRFEVIAISFGPDDGSAMRRRLESAFDRFVDVRRLPPGERSDLALARHMAALGIDIAIDLKGYTRDARPGILAHRPAPIQVNYLGYPGTTGAGFIDYVLVDPLVVPAEQQAHYTERLVHLPDCYQANDTRRPIAATTPSRADCGLPEDGFVFCSFNNSYKLVPEVFDVWMRLLRAVPGSVLWLLAGSAPLARNLAREAEARDVDPGRLVLAPFRKLPEHLARQRLADLFLDTLPFGAHTTASDALWAGLPVVTCRGRTFPGRVAASLLHAIGLPELVAGSLEEYEALALALARDAARLAQFRSRLAANRLTTPLFDIERFRRHIEAAYDEMWQRWLRGAPPHPFAVEPSSS